MDTEEIGFARQLVSSLQKASHIFFFFYGQIGLDDLCNELLFKTKFEFELTVLPRSKARSKRISGIFEICLKKIIFSKKNWRKSCFFVLFLKRKKISNLFLRWKVASVQLEIFVYALMM